MFNVRLSADCSEAYYRAAKSYMEDFADVFDSDTLDYLSELLAFFFFESDANGNIVQRRTTIDEDYSDFALSNIFLCLLRGEVWKFSGKGYGLYGENPGNQRYGTFDF